MTPRGVAAVGCAGLAFAGAAAGAASAAAPCLASARSVPAEGHPGQQLVWRLEILRREDVTDVGWIEPPAFPGFRVEWLPGQPELGGVTRGGVEYVGRVEERALFAERAGELEIAPKGVRCSLANGGSYDAVIAPTRVSVRELPGKARPPDFSGLVGTLSLEVKARPRRLALGGSARLEVELSGDANLWDAPDPLAGAGALAGAEVFTQRPRLELDPGVELRVRRTFVYDVVPGHEGRLLIPALRVPYYDPARQAYAVATSRALSLRVLPRPPERGAADEASAPSPGAEPTTRAPAGWALAALAAAAALALAWHRRRARGADVLAELSASPGTDAAALARALRRALAPWLPAAHGVPVEELRAPPDASPALRRALALLTAAERARFDPKAAPPPRAEVIAAIESLARG